LGSCTTSNARNGFGRGNPYGWKFLTSILINELEIFGKQIIVFQLVIYNLDHS